MSWRRVCASSRRTSGSAARARRARPPTRAPRMTCRACCASCGSARAAARCSRRWSGGKRAGGERVRGERCGGACTCKQLSRPYVAGALHGLCDAAINGGVIFHAGPLRSVWVCAACLPACPVVSEHDVHSPRREHSWGMQKPPPKALMTKDDPTEQQDGTLGNQGAALAISCWRYREETVLRLSRAFPGLEEIGAAKPVHQLDSG